MVRNEKLNMKEWVKNMDFKKLLIPLLVLYASLSGVLYADSAEAVLSQNEVVKGNMAQLRLVAEGNGVEFPRIDKIGSVPVLGRSRTQNTSLQVINGKSSLTHTTNLILTFEPTQDMTIPSFTITIDGKTYKTKPLKLKVVKSSAPKGASSGMFSLTMKANKTEVIVGEPLVVTVYFSLRNDVRLSENPQYNRPEFKGFFVKEVSDEKRYVKGNYHITELRYILVPQKPGEYHIEPATAKIGLADTSRRDIFGRFFGTIWKPVSSNSLTVKVDPAPQNADLIGHFYVESKIDKTKTKANKPVNLTVTIEGDGSLEDYQMPNYDIDGVTVYSDDAEVTTRVIGNKLKSTYVKKFAFIADHSFDIPKRTITAYDPKTKETKTLEIPGYSIEVEAPKSVASAPVQTSGNSGQNGTLHTDLKLSPQGTVVSGKTGVKNTVNIPAWWLLVVAFLAGMATMYLLGKVRWKRGARPFKESDALKILYAHMSEDPQVEAMVRKLYAKKNGQKDVIIDKKELKALVERYTKK